MAPARDPEFLREVWALYGIGTLWILLRFAVNIRIAGVRGLRLDDAFAFVALAAWTFTSAIIDITYHIGTNTDFTQEEIARFDERKFRSVVYGSQLFLGSWYAYIVLIFSLKAIVLRLYSRIFFERWQVWVFRITSALCAMGFVAITVGLSLRCLPFHQRWQLVPQPPLSCTASPMFLITASCVNAVTDILLLSAPIPILWTLNKPMHTRIGVFVLLASGMFVLVACITRVSLTVVPNVSVLNIARWGVREFCIAIVAVNSASLRPLTRKSFWRPKTLGAKGHQKQTSNIFPPLQRIRQHLSRSRHGEVLNSTSAGASTMDAYAGENMGEDTVFEDPDYQVVNPAAQDRDRSVREQQTQHSMGTSRHTSRSHVTRYSDIRQTGSMNEHHDEIATNWGVDASRKVSTAEDVDLEKGDYVCHAELLRNDSVMPWIQSRPGDAEENEKEDTIHSRE